MQINSALSSELLKVQRDRAQSQKKVTTASLPTTPSRLLPSNFAQRLLKLQEMCEQSRATSQNILELIQLYTNAVEHYESLSSDKYLYYKGRLQQALSNPKLLKIMKNPTKNDRKIKKEEESLFTVTDNYFITEEEKVKMQREKIKELEREHERKVKQRAQKLNFYQEKKKAESDGSFLANQLVSKSVSKAQNKIQSLKDDLGDQNEQFMKKLAMRKNRKKKRSMAGSASASKFMDEEDRPTSVIGVSCLADQSTRADSAIHPRPASVNSLRRHQKNSIGESFMSDDPFETNIDDISESGLSFSISMIQDKIQQDLQNEMKQLWLQTEAEVAKLNKDRDEKVEGLLERYAEQKFNKIAEIRQKYDAQIVKVQKKPLPAKLKEKMTEKLKKEKEEQIHKFSDLLQVQKKQEIEEIKVEYEVKRRASVKGNQIEKTMQRMRSLTKHTRSQRSNSIKSKRRKESPIKQPRAQNFVNINLVSKESLHDSVTKGFKDSEKISPAPQKLQRKGGPIKAFILGKTRAGVPSTFGPGSGGITESEINLQTE